MPLKYSEKFNESNYQRKGLTDNCQLQLPVLAHLTKPHNSNLESKKTQMGEFFFFFFLITRTTIVVKEETIIDSFVCCGLFYNVTIDSHQ